MVTSLFLVFVFMYSLVSCRLERTVITAPIVFAAAGLLTFLVPERGQHRRARGIGTVLA